MLIKIYGCEGFHETSFKIFLQFNLLIKYVWTLTMVINNGNIIIEFKNFILFWRSL